MIPRLYSTTLPAPQLTMCPRLQINSGFRARHSDSRTPESDALASIPLNTQRVNLLLWT